jgi:hypothetical protein
MTNELQLVIKDEELLTAIRFNYDELKTSLSERLQKYKGLVVTEEAIADAKTDRAGLNKLEKSLADKGREIQARILSGFDTKLKELRGMITSTSNSIDVQVKKFEQAEKDKKKALIELYYDTVIGDLKEVLPFGRLFKPQWLNLGSRMPMIEGEISQAIDTVKKDLSVIDTLKSEYVLQIKDVYLSTLDLSGALAEKARLEKRAADIKAMETKAAIPEIAPEVPETAPVIAEDDLSDMPWANPSTLPKDTVFRVTCTADDLEMIEKFFSAHEIKYSKE